MWYKVIILIAAIVEMVFKFKAEHVQKCAYHDLDDKYIGFAIGSALAFIVNAFAAWYVIDFFLNN